MFNDVLAMYPADDGVAEETHGIFQILLKAYQDGQGSVWMVFGEKRYTSNNHAQVSNLKQKVTGVYWASLIFFTRMLRAGTGLDEQ